MTKSVKVTATADQFGVVDFDIDGVKAKQARMKLAKDSGAQAIDFELRDQTGKGLQFDTNDPIWVGEDCPCPPQRGINSDQITIGGASASRLSTVNSNSGRARELRYQLNFLTNDGSALNCDPVIENGGGIKT